MILSQSRTDVFIDTKNYSHGGSPMNLTITFADYFYSKCYFGRSATSADATGEATTHTTRHNHHRKGPTWFRSLDFGERNGYLKDPARFHSLDFSERNGYLKGVAPIDAQQKNMEILTFSCSRGSSWIGMLPAKV